MANSCATFIASTEFFRVIVDVHTHVWESPCHIGESFIADAKAVAGEGFKDIHVDLDKHWTAMQPVDRAVGCAL